MTVASNPAKAKMDEIEYLICDVANLWRKVLSAETKQLNISGLERRVLYNIEPQPGLNQVQIANITEIEPQNLIRILDKLEQAGLIEKQNDPKDRRTKRIYITLQGRTVNSEIRAIAKSIQPSLLVNVDPNKVQELMAALGTIKENLMDYLCCDETKP